MELKDRIEIVKGYEATKKKWRTKYDSKEFKEASALNGAIFGIPLNHAAKCQCIEDLFYYIKNLTDEKLTKTTIKMNQKFKLKAGIVITLHAFNHAITPANLTDDIAIELLTKYPGHIVSFEVFPADWKKLCEAAPKAPKGKGKKDADADFEAMKATCQEKEYPAEEWDGLDKDELAAYIETKNNADKTPEEILVAKVAELATKKKDALVKICKADKKLYPAAEWKDLTRDELAAYIAPKVLIPSAE